MEAVFYCTASRFATLTKKKEKRRMKNGGRDTRTRINTTRQTGGLLRGYKPRY